MATPVKIARTTRGLRDALFDEMDALSSGKSNPHVASAKAKLAVQIINTTRLEIEYHKFITEQPPANKMVAVDLKPIALGKSA